MKAAELTKIIKEALREVVKEELSEILLEALKSNNRNIISENVAPRAVAPKNTDLGVNIREELERAMRETQNEDQSSSFSGDFVPDLNAEMGSLPNGEVSFDQIRSLIG